jgi:hypothetical protein
MRKQAHVKRSYNHHADSTPLPRQQRCSLAFEKTTPNIEDAHAQVRIVHLNHHFIDQNLAGSGQATSIFAPLQRRCRSPHLDSTVTSLRVVRRQIRKQSKIRREVDFVHVSCTSGAPPLKLETLPITTTGPHHLLSLTSYMKRVHSYHISTERPH